jgi:FkbM family methyltransferase
MNVFDKVRGHTFLKNAIGKSPIIVDLGANHGDFSRELRNRFGGKYFLYEANPKLAATLPSDNNQCVVNAAVSIASGTVKFNVAKNDEASSILQLPQESVYNAIVLETVEVPSLNLDDIIKSIPGEIINLVKVDIEGAEAEILSNCSQESLDRIGQITVEFHCDPSFGFNLLQATNNAIKRIRRAGFVYIDFSGGNMNNVLFINRRLHDISRFKEISWRFRQCPPESLLFLWRLVPNSFRRFIRRHLDTATNL